MDYKKIPVIKIAILAIVIIIIIIILSSLFCKSKCDNYEQYNNVSKKAFVGAWASNIECGQGLKYVSLASALPQNWPNIDLFFSGNIEGIYSPDLSNGYTKYLISIGGSNASPAGWGTFLNNPVNTAGTLYTAMKNRGIVGLDFDLEGTSKENQDNIKILISNIKNLDPNIIIMYTILLGSPNTFSSLITDGQMDFITLMLYNGGMYVANSTGGAGCDWDQWAELFLSGCTTCNCKPLGLECSSYCANIGTIAKYKNKIVLGVITDTSKNAITSDQIIRAMNLCYKYNGAGIFFWVLPGFVSKCSQKNICQNFLGLMSNYNVNINNYFDIPPQRCPLICPSKKAGCCPNAKNGCNACSGKCIATSCGTKNSITDELCSPCLQGKQTWWPCNVHGACQCNQASKPDNVPECPNNPDPCPSNAPSPAIPITPITPNGPNGPISPVGPFYPINPVSPNGPVGPFYPISPSPIPYKYVTLDCKLTNI